MDKEQVSGIGSDDLLEQASVELWEICMQTAIDGFNAGKYGLSETECENRTEQFTERLRKFQRDVSPCFSDCIRNRKEQKGISYMWWYELTFQEQVQRAKKCREGEVWINPRTGRKATVEGNDGSGLELVHESGRITRIQHHYFADNYYPDDMRIATEGEEG